jgi:hypothetical protein
MQTNNHLQEKVIVCRSTIIRQPCRNEINVAKNVILGVNRAAESQALHFHFLWILWILEKYSLVLVKFPKCLTKYFLLFWMLRVHFLNFLDIYIVKVTSDLMDFDNYANILIISCHYLPIFNAYWLHTDQPRTDSLSESNFWQISHINSRTNKQLHIET